MTRDEGTKGLRDKGEGRRGFSLVEVLLAIFIMGIGIIAVAALFPAGIAQQRLSTDDIIGPIVANNALAILRTRLRPDDFGTFEEFPGSSYVSPTIEGDWTWRRPGFYFTQKTISVNDPFGFSTTEAVRPGSISIFPNTASQLDANSEIPWNTETSPYGSNNGPVIIFNQAERSYPMQTQKGLAALGPAQYVWDCMFRRYQGKILVAIFVYRVTAPGGGGQVYTVPPPPGSNMIPPLPIDLVLDPATPYNGEGMWDAGKTMIKATVDPVSNPYDLKDQYQAWQEPRQWILDQNNNVHRTLSRFIGDNGEARVELVRPVPEGINVATNYYPLPINLSDTDNNGLFDRDIVSRIWYLPLEVPRNPQDPNDTSTYMLTPVYLTVGEL